MVLSQISTYQDAAGVPSASSKRPTPIGAPRILLVTAPFVAEVDFASGLKVVLLGEDLVDDDFIRPLKHPPF